MLYIPLLIVLFLWRRAASLTPAARKTQPRHRFGGALYRQLAVDPHRADANVVTGLLGGSVSALMPLVARDLLHGGAQTYGIMLGAFGMGAVIGALNIGEVRKRLSGEAAVRACALIMGVAIAVIAVSHTPVLTAAALVVADRYGCWRSRCSTSACNYRRRAGSRAARWRHSRPRSPAASRSGAGMGPSHRPCRRRDGAIVSAAAMFVSPLLGLWLEMPPIGGRNEAADLLADPEVRLPLTGRSGPLVVEIEYRVDPGSAGSFTA